MKEDGERLYLNIQGDGSGLLIGRKGETLDALEYLVNKMVHKGAEEKKKIVVDTENYRSPQGRIFGSTWPTAWPIKDKSWAARNH